MVGSVGSRDRRRSSDLPDSLLIMIKITSFDMLSGGLGDQEHDVNEQFELFQVLIMCPPIPHFPLSCPVYKEQRKSTLFYGSFFVRILV